MTEAACDGHFADGSAEAAGQERLPGPSSCVRSRGAPGPWRVRACCRGRGQEDGRFVLAALGRLASGALRVEVRAPGLPQADPHGASLTVPRPLLQGRLCAERCFPLAVTRAQEVA